MLEEFRNESLVLMTYYHIDGDVENEDNIDKLAFEASQSSTTRINFDDENMLLGSTLHNRPLFVVGYICEQRVNCILIDDGSASTYSPF